MSFLLRDVSVRHPLSSASIPALEGVSLSIEPGEQLALIGSSGAGKSTLLHTLAFALQPDSGHVQAFGVQPWALSNKERHKLRAHLFLAPQTPPLPPRQRVVTAVLAGRLAQWGSLKSLTSLIKPADPQLAFDALRRLHLEDKLYARVDRLSGGERQRCGLARLLVSPAEAFLVDEPLSALDPALARQTLSVLQQEAKTRKASLICSLHQVELAREYFPRIIGLKDGRVAFDASREKVTDAMVAALFHHEKNPGAIEPDWNNPLDSDAENAGAPRTPLAARCF